LRVVPEIRSAKDLKSSAKSVLILGGITLLLAAPYFILGRQHLIDYYRLNVFGSAAALWTPNLSAINSALYYIVGPGGNATLGKWVYIGIPAVAFMSLRSWRIGVLILISYLVVTLPGNKSPYLGMIFNAYVVAAIVLMMAWLLTITNPAIRYAIAGAFLVFGLVTYRLPSPGNSPGVAEARQKLNADVVSVLLADSAIERKIIYIPVIASYLNGESIVFSALQAGHLLQDVLPSFFDGDLENHVREAYRSDYLILISTDYSDTVKWTPSIKIANDLFAQVSQNNSFELAKSISTDPGQIRIYRRK
jgi:hypothetical protein